jgi:DNA-binding CsgD family transcriptional regulator
VLERIAAPSLATDAHGTIRWLNPAAVELLGFVRGRRLASTVAPHDVSRLRKVFAGWLSNGNSTTVDAALITPSGALAPCTLSSTALHRDGLVIGILTVVTRTPRLHHPPPVAPERLTPRQFEVLQLIASGATTSDIASTLHLSSETVRNHVRALLIKLNAKSRLEAVAIARRDNLVIAPERLEQRSLH